MEEFNRFLNEFDIDDGNATRNQRNDERPFRQNQNRQNQNRQNYTQHNNQNLNENRGNRAGAHFNRGKQEAGGRKWRNNAGDREKNNHNFQRPGRGRSRGNNWIQRGQNHGRGVYPNACEYKLK